MAARPRATPLLASAPGKLILAGEHAVVYGRPALVCAISRYVHVTIVPAGRAEVGLDAPGIGYRGRLSFPAVRKVVRKARERCRLFAAGAIPVESIAPRPEDLPWFAAGLALEHCGEDASGLQVQLVSQLPPESGCGSSAAVACAVVGGIAAACGKPLSKDLLFQLVREAEKLRHGTPSGVDPAAAVFGGVMRFQNGTFERLAAGPQEFTLVYTGKPESTTGECVSAVRRRGPAPETWDEFQQVVGNMHRAVETGDHQGLVSAMRKNHRLLCGIGVVPERIQRFIAAVERRGGAGKVCGAGTIRGDAAGILWIVGAGYIDDVCREYGYATFTCGVDESGFKVGQRIGSR